MGNYFPPRGFPKCIKEDCESQCISGNLISGNGTHCHRNHFVEGWVKRIETAIRSVRVIEHLHNDAYDDLLASSIVFLYLHDCSAVNTVLECIVRNTPIIVNRLPALEEILGTTYPGFYNNLIEASLLADNLQQIKAMHAHLCRLNKTRYKLDHFVQSILKIVALSS